MTDQHPDQGAPVPPDFRALCAELAEAQWALVQMLDGVKRHDLPDQLGLSDKDLDRIWVAYESARTALAELRAARRPKPVSLKEQALADLASM